jgi:hypothetical protein
VVGGPQRIARRRDLRAGAGHSGTPPAAAT